MNPQVTPAAQYVRMSTDGQDLSPAIQRAAIASYAAANGFEVVESYEDLGRSGVLIEHRTRMQQMIADVMRPGCPFKAVLVYDVSRWGRFQDTDASAYYEYHCRLNGVRVIYVGEPFGSDLSPVTAVIKNLKRAMAAEYSREMSLKIRAGQMHRAELRYQMGNIPCIGLRRVAERKDGTSSREMRDGERSNVEIERVRWVPGPANEIAAVRKVFDLFTCHRMPVAQIVRHLKDEGIRSRTGATISKAMVRTILHCEAFIGNFVWGRTKTDAPLSKPMRVPPRRVEGVLPSTISMSAWKAAQVKLSAYSRIVPPREYLLKDLRTALQRSPRMTQLELVGNGCAPRAAYEREFGSMREAFRLAGRCDEQVSAARWKRRSKCHSLGIRVANDICELLRTTGIVCNRISRRAAIRTSSGQRVRIVLCEKRPSLYGSLWKVCKYGKQPDDDFVLIGRLRGDAAIEDFFLISGSRLKIFPLWSAEADRPEGALWVNSAEGLCEALTVMLAGEAGEGDERCPQPRLKAAVP